MSEYLAHSATENAPAQSYRNHVVNVVARARCYLRKIMLYATNWPRQWTLSSVTLAGEVHDLGKLDESNQKVLRGERRSAHLPFPHVDAGVAYLLSKEAYLAAFLVHSHHSGLPDCMMFRENADFRDDRVCDVVDEHLLQYIERHSSSHAPMDAFNFETTPDILPMDWRLLFSCLVHADHGDTASARSGRTNGRVRIPKLRPHERLAQLKEYVESLPFDKRDAERRGLRESFFLESCEVRARGSIVFCDAPVGSGKTTSVMAYLLRLAEERKLRRIFVVLPFTSIITQSVAVYRKALTIDGEDAHDVVAEIHHLADFETSEARQLTALWDAPIVVTTAVAFFETLASNRPSTLRRMQNLPGSAIFLDEAHAMLPIRFLPLAWRWMCHLSDVGMCQWVLASGSLAAFWRFPGFVNRDGVPRKVESMIGSDVTGKLKCFEARRIDYRFKGEDFMVASLIDWVVDLDGPVILVLNTVHTAAVVAKALCEKLGMADVYHLSTALTSKDRKVTLDHVMKRLHEKNGSRQWCLVATSCVEAGMDFSFRTGVREMASVASLIQMAGRVNRNGEYGSADVWSFGFSAEEKQITGNPGVAISAAILHDSLKRGDKITAELCSSAMKRELVQAQAGNMKLAENLISKENDFAFKTVAESFHVIDDCTELVVVDSGLIERIEEFAQVDWHQIQEGSVRIRRKLLDKVGTTPSHRYPEIWLWKHPYSALLGYMEYVLQLKEIDSDSYVIV